MMSLGRGSPPEYFDASGLPIPDGGGSTLIPIGCFPFKVSFMASKEHSMRASSGDGGNDVGSARDDAPLPRFP
jgi:hypothetical protein